MSNTSEIKYGLMALGFEVLACKNKLPSDELRRQKDAGGKSGVYLATQNTALVKEWEQTHTEFGLRLNDGTVCLDVDIDKPGASSLDDVCSLFGLDKTKTPLLKWRGYKLFVRVPRPIAKRLGLLPGLDILTGVGSYAIIEGIHPVTGNQVEWINSPLGLELPMLSEEALKLIETPKREKSSSLNPEVGELFLDAGTGRWSHLQRIAGRLRAWGLGYEAIYGCLVSISENHCEYDETIADRKLVSLATWASSLPPQNNLRNETNETVLVRLPSGEEGEISIHELDVALRGGAEVIKR